MSKTEIETPRSAEAPGLALRFAQRLHLGQHRKQTHEQYVAHPIRVAELVTDADMGRTALSAAYLHDLVEKTPVQLAEINERFGADVAYLVDALSEDPEIENYCDRKRALRQQVIAAGRTAAALYAADRVANIRDWISVPSDGRNGCAERLGTTLEDRITLWSEDFEELTEFDPELPFLEDIGSGLDQLRSEA